MKYARMYINLQSLLKLPVFTESGQKVGAISDLEIDVESHSIRHYIVEHGIIGKEHYWVAPVQVKSIDTEKVIVDDTILTDPALKVVKGDKPAAPTMGGVVSNTYLK